MKTFQNLGREASRHVLQTGNAAVMRDATAVPFESPLTFDTNIVTIAVPTNAAEIVVKPSVALRVGYDSTLADGYYVVNASERELFPVAGTSTLYIRGDAATGILQFFFITI